MIWVNGGNDLQPHHWILARCHFLGPPYNLPSSVYYPRDPRLLSETDVVYFTSDQAPMGNVLDADFCF
jgi:hypothetical protein